MSAPNKRRDTDFYKLLMSDFIVETIDDSTNQFNVVFHGPKESPYEGGVWKIQVKLPDSYPYKRPSIKFLNKILHPNIDESSGAVCMNVINETWNSAFDLANVFETFLPLLLLYPNPSDPFNVDAAVQMLRDKEQYEKRVKEYCEQYAKRENILGPPVEGRNTSEDSDGKATSSDDETAEP
ncbi:hypothetical protein SOVF_174180 [Spinacia oleracea]|nr:ubiquitin-conjugating enzyme E2 6-like isoform X2 [Spinacia oleracea]KNA07186.1 hypothetical protein SOVF_174180 [Spinacia oleracea]